MTNKKITTLIIIFIVAILGVISFGLYDSYFKDRWSVINEEPVINDGNKDVVLFKNIFNIERMVPGTNIIFKYPSEGFYGLGIDILNNEEIKNRELISGIRIKPTSEFDINKRSEYVTITINLIRNEKDFIDINDFINDYKQDQKITVFEREYAKENGRFIEINGKKYFIYKLTEDAIRWHAFTLNETEIVYVTLTYTGGDVDYNDKLFLEILENISFK